VEAASNPYEGEDDVGVTIKPTRRNRVSDEGEGGGGGEKDPELSRLTSIVSNVFSHLVFLVLGGVLIWYLMPRILVMAVPVDPKTGQQIGTAIPIDPKTGQPIGGAIALSPDGQHSVQPPAPGAQPEPTAPKSGDGH
jgi:hypothetical protein